MASRDPSEFNLAHLIVLRWASISLSNRFALISYIFAQLFVSLSVYAMKFPDDAPVNNFNRFPGSLNVVSNFMEAKS